MILFLVATLVLTPSIAKKTEVDFKNHLSDDFFDYINTVQDSWTAGRNFPVNTPMEYLRRLSGVTRVNGSKPALHFHVIDDGDKLPETFDAREHWPNCESLKEIRDQGDCGSGWAFAAVEIMTDRTCIHSGAKQRFHFSALDLQTCCYPCRKSVTGCSDGSVYDSWIHFYNTGVASGGNYNSSEGCKPYPYQSCYHNFENSIKSKNNIQAMTNCSEVIEKHLICFYGCDTSNLIYIQDLRGAKDIYIISEDEQQIRQEIYKNGPVEATLDIYSDFMSYKKGVYNHTAGEKIGNHVVKIIGWGVENQNKYWLVANSWNEYWGDQGFFKILRGENHCGIEENIITGLPELVD